MLELNKIHQGDTRELIKQIPDRLVQTIVTSPPYFGKRDYQTGKWVGGDPVCDHQPARTRKGKDRGISSSKLEGSKGNVGHQQEGYIRKCGKCGAVREDRQMGLEITPEIFLRQMVTGIFKQCHRILKNDGTLWLNIGDGNWGGKGRSGQESVSSLEKRAKEGKSMNKGHQNTGLEIRAQDRKHEAYKPKDLIGMPWRLAFALQGIVTLPGKRLDQWCKMLDAAIATQDWSTVEICRQQIYADAFLQCFTEHGWYLRQDIVWYKPNVQPESVKDRPSVCHEYIFLLSKSKKYKYNKDAIMEPCSENTHPRISRASRDLIRQGYTQTEIPGAEPGSGIKNNSSFVAATSTEVVEKRNKRSVWTVNSEPSYGGHTATYPQSLITPCILAGSDEGDIVYDPFAGEGTTMIVAQKLKRKWLGTELNEKDIKTFNERLHHEFGMFL